jgi:hypothetical protein
MKVSTEANQDSSITEQYNQMCITRSDRNYLRKDPILPFGSVDEYVNRSPASPRRRRKGKSQNLEGEIWSRVPWDSDPRMTALARVSSNCKRKNRPDITPDYSKAMHAADKPVHYISRS